MGKNPLLLTQKSTYINQNIAYYQYRGSKGFFSEEEVDLYNRSH